MASTSTTEKRTVVTKSSESYEDDSPMHHYKSGIGPRSTNIASRTSIGSPLRSGSSGGYSRTVEYSSSSGTSFANPGAYSNISQHGANNVKNTREREKRDMQDLNERFANYIEKVRFLEAQNRKLASELEQLKSKWGQETSAIKQMYETELSEARKLIDDTNKDKARMDTNMRSMEEKMMELQRQFDDAKRYRSIDRDQINKLNQQVSDQDSEITMLRRNLESMDTERGRDKANITRLEELIEKLRHDLNNETLAHLDAENRRQTLAEEIEFLKTVHDQELKELAALAYRDTTAENREYWKSELSQAIRDIQMEYDSKVDIIHANMESYYNLKVQEFRTGSTKQNMEVTHAKEETKKYRSQLNDVKGRLADLESRNQQLEKAMMDLTREMEQKDQDWNMEKSRLLQEIQDTRQEMEAMLTELQSLMDAKLSLELEIAAYRKLLEGEESRTGLRSKVKHRETKPVAVERPRQVESQASYSLMKGEVSAKTTYQRTSKGPLSIPEVNPEGKFVVIENSISNRKTEAIGGWKIRRIVDGRKYEYSCPNLTLAPGKRIKIWGGGFAKEATGASDYIFHEEDSWGVGSDASTVLINDKNEDKSSHIQKTVYK